jgi:murein L,D-transpeptidase YcbB/YkuD
MLLNRRKLLTTMAAAGAAAALPSALRAEEESIWDIFARNRVLREADTGANTQNAMSAIDTVEPILSFDTANNLQYAIQQHQFIVDNGGWDPMSREVYHLTLGKNSRGVIRLKRRLMWSQDMVPAKNPDDFFDEETDAGLRRFQARHGLQVTGAVDEATLYALAVPADYRLTQLHLNAMRVQSFAENLGADRYVVVNIPAASIEAVGAGMVEQRHTAVVGRIERQTPILASKIHEINFNPYWHVPKSIIQRDIIKYMNDDPEYLTKYRIHIYDGSGREIMPTEIDWTTEEAVNYQFRQEPGAENSMGHVKINFHNPYNVYLHDTPQKGLFGENARFHSSGCMRVENVDQLVAWLLRDNGGWDIGTVTAAFESNERLDVSVSNPVPIHTTYITAWANRQGTVSFRDDVYSFDQEGKVQFEG